MNFDLSWILLGLPLAFALGWVASRMDIRQLRFENQQAPKAYFKGLNFLLNEQQDEAIDAFAQLPGIGQKSALRMVLHLLKTSPENVNNFGEEIFSKVLLRTNSIQFFNIVINVINRLMGPDIMFPNQYM